MKQHTKFFKDVSATLKVSRKMLQEIRYMRISILAALSKFFSVPGTKLQAEPHLSFFLI